jgi:hypothetical protein
VDSRRREQAIENYPEVLSRWESVQSAELERWLAAHPQVRAVMADEQQRRDQLREDNRRTIERNRERTAPRVVKQPTAS